MQHLPQPTKPQSKLFIAFLLAIDCFKVIRAEIVEEEPFEESIPHPKTLVG
jgi:hypothetical protein